MERTSSKESKLIKELGAIAGITLYFGASAINGAIQTLKHGYYHIRGVKHTLVEDDPNHSFSFYERDY
jgi:hypothetical protein